VFSVTCSLTTKTRPTHSNCAREISCFFCQLCRKSFSEAGNLRKHETSASINEHWWRRRFVLQQQQSTTTTDNTLNEFVNSRKTISTHKIIFSNSLQVHVEAVHLETARARSRRSLVRLFSFVECVHESHFNAIDVESAFLSVIGWSRTRFGTSRSIWIAISRQPLKITIKKESDNMMVEFVFRWNPIISQFSGWYIACYYNSIEGNICIVVVGHGRRQCVARRRVVGRRQHKCVARRRGALVRHRRCAGRQVIRSLLNRILLTNILHRPLVQRTELDSTRRCAKRRSTRTDACARRRPGAAATPCER
jgi:hypothetical protein